MIFLVVTTSQVVADAPLLIVEQCAKQRMVLYLLIRQPEFVRRLIRHGHGQLKKYFSAPNVLSTSSPFLFDLFPRESVQ